MCRLRSILAAGLLVASPLAAMAQPPDFTPLQRPERPTVSPYLGLLGGTSAGINYYEIYRPQQEFRRDVRQLNRDVNRVRTNVNRFGLSDAPEYEQYQLGPTGHPTMFMNTRGYFSGSR